MSLPPPGDLGDLIQQAQAGSDAAAQMLFERYRQPLLTVIRAFLSRPLRKLYDSEDFLQDTFEAIFKTYFTQQVLYSPQNLWPYLKKIAENKVRDANRKHLLSQRHNITLEVSLENTAAYEEATSRELSPEEALLLKELVEERLVDLLDQLPSTLREIIQLVMRGHNVQEIAHKLNLDPKRIYRAIGWLNRKVLE
jgi:RNA polymerase sigma factor (sigma-70 family)